MDTGIDYTHPVFCNLDGTTRIAGIWDQTIQDGDPPEGFLYGTEYTEERINAALHSESPQELIQMGMEHLLQVWLPEVQKAVDSFLGLPRRR